MLQLQHRFPWYMPLFLAIALLGIAACDDNATDAGNNNGTGDTTLTDRQILHIARTLNQGEVLTNQPAVAKATSDSLRQFAQMMVTEHGRTVQRIDSMATARGMTLQTNPVSVTLNNSAQGIVAKLNAQSGAAFDLTYLESQHTLHHQALDMLDYTLIPKAQDAQVRTMLTEMRGAVQAHLNQVRTLMMAMM